MSAPIAISELDALKLQNAQLKLELLIERVQRQVDEAKASRDTVLETVCKPYIPADKSLADYQIDLEKKQISLRPEDASELSPESTQTEA